MSYDSEESTKPQARTGRSGDGGDRSMRSSISSSERPLNLAKSQLPLSLVITLIVMSISAAGSWWQLSSHAQNRTIHLDEKDVIEGGGVAYKNDVRQLRWDFEHRLTKMLRSVTVNCRYVKTGNLDSVCTVMVPESAE